MTDEKKPSFDEIVKGEFPDVAPVHGISPEIKGLLDDLDVRRIVYQDQGDPYRQADPVGIIVDMRGVPREQAQEVYDILRAQKFPFPKQKLPENPITKLKDLDD